jgi:DnaJ-class molecular chaperone
MIKKKSIKSKEIKIKTCEVCNGRGLIGVNEEAVICKTCDGSGKVKV